VPNAVDLDPATDVQSTSKTLFTRSGKTGNGDLSVLGGGNIVIWSTNGRLKAKLGTKISVAILSCIDNMISHTSTIEDNIALIPPSALH
jgi:hypothetical protein